ncbi:MAG: hypothetical protein NVS4B11_05150 [Ktedonobacteraceae bacterium]
MKQYTFSVGNKPRVVISRVDGNLLVQSWPEQSVSVRIIGENPDGSTAQPYNEGETVFINNGKGDIELYVPYERKLFGRASRATDISVTDLNGAVTMENVGNVTLSNISGDVVLTLVDGTLRATNAPTLRERKGIGGDAILENIALLEMGAVGAALKITRAETVKVGAVGNSVHAEQIGARFQCGAIGGSCEIRDSANVAVSLNNVGGSLHLDGIAHMPSCNVGGSATLGLPRNTNLTMHLLAGGSISGEAVQQKCGNMATLTYGTGSASLNMTAGGSIKLNWATDAASPNTTQKREAILNMVAQGRITPEEGNMLLDALGA